MDNYKILRPIGMEEICTEMEKVCTRAKMYRHNDRRPGPYIVYLDEGDGITTLLNYVEDMMLDKRVIDFSYVLDMTLELKFTTDLSPFEIDRTGAVYLEDYTGIEAHILTEDFARTYFSSSYEEYISKVKKINKHTMLFFFVPRNPSRNMQTLIEKIRHEVMDIGKGERSGSIIKIPDYSCPQLAEMIERKIDDDGIDIENRKDFMADILEVLEERKAGKAKEAMAIADRLEYFADYGDFHSRIDDRAVKSAYPACFYKEEVKDEQKREA